MSYCWTRYTQLQTLLAYLSPLINVILLDKIHTAPDLGSLLITTNTHLSATARHAQPQTLLAYLSPLINALMLDKTHTAPNLKAHSPTRMRVMLLDKICSPGIKTKSGCCTRQWLMCTPPALMIRSASPGTQNI